MSSALHLYIYSTLEHNLIQDSDDRQGPLPPQPPTNSLSSCLYQLTHPSSFPNSLIHETLCTCYVLTPRQQCRDQQRQTPRPQLLVGETAIPQSPRLKGSAHLIIPIFFAYLLLPQGVSQAHMLVAVFTVPLGHNLDENDLSDFMCSWRL